MQNQLLRPTSCNVLTGHIFLFSSLPALYAVDLHMQTTVSYPSAYKSRNGCYRLLKVFSRRTIASMLLLSAAPSMRALCCWQSSKAFPDPKDPAKLRTTCTKANKTVHDLLLASRRHVTDESRCLQRGSEGSLRCYGLPYSPKSDASSSPMPDKGIADCLKPQQERSRPRCRWPVRSIPKKKGCTMTLTRGIPIMKGPHDKLAKSGR